MTRDASLIGVFSAEAGEAPPLWHDPIPARRGGARDGAGRPSKGAGARSVKVPVFLTPAEAARLDEQRGALTRSEWLASPLRPTPAAADFRPVRK